MTGIDDDIWQRIKLILLTVHTINNIEIRMTIRIISTLGPTSFDPNIIHGLDLAGTDIFRINLSHTSLEQCDRLASIIRSTSMKAICFDTEGPQVRVGNIPDIYLKKGDKVFINSNSLEFISIPLNYQLSLKEGDILFVGMNKLTLKVVSTERGILAEVIISGLLSKNKAVYIPQLDLSIFPTLTEKDESVLELIRKYDVDYLTCSYVRNELDVEYLLKRFNGFNVSIIPKIELRQAIDKVSEIFDLVDTILIDRGDLSKATSLFEVPFLQRGILDLAKSRGKKVFLATHLMEHTLSPENMPTISEVSDIYSLIHGGVSGFVFAQETAIGVAPIEIIETMKYVIDYYHKFNNGVNINGYG